MLFKNPKKEAFKKQKENPKFKAKDVKILKSPYTLDLEPLDHLFTLLSTPSLRKNGYRKILSDEKLLTDNFEKIFNQIFNLWLEGDTSSLILGCINKMSKMNNIKFINESVYGYFKSAILMKKMTKNLYKIFFKVCKNNIIEEKEEILKYIHDEYKDRIIGLK